MQHGTSTAAHSDIDILVPCRACGGEGTTYRSDPECRGCLDFDHGFGCCAGYCADDFTCEACEGTGQVWDEREVAA